MSWSPRTALWTLRCSWAALAVVGALAVGRAAEGRGHTASTVGAVAWWSAVGIVVVALAVPGVIGLAVVRLVSPLAAVAALTALVVGAPATPGGAWAGIAALVSAVAMSAETGEAFVQASAYGQETRFPLRPPAAMLPAVVVSWAIWAAAVTATAFLLVDAEWVPGAVLGVVAAAATWWVARGTRRLCRRWLVLVPAGLVVHDEVVLAETLMVQRPNLRLARLALADTEALDLTGPSGGHAVEVTVGDMELAALRPSPARPNGGAVHVQSFLVAPSRPGRALRAITDRSPSVG